MILATNNSHSSPNRMADGGMQSSMSSDETMNSANLAMNGSGGGGRLDSRATATTSSARQSNDSDDDDMDVTEIEESSSVINGALNGTYLNGQSHFDPRDPQPAENRGNDGHAVLSHSCYEVILLDRCFGFISGKRRDHFCC